MLSMLQRYAQRTFGTVVIIVSVTNTGKMSMYFSCIFSCVYHVFAHVYLMYFSCILKTCISHVFQNMYFSCISHVFLMYFTMPKMRNQCISHVFSKSMLFVKWEINVFLMYFFRLRRFGFLEFSKYMRNTWEIHVLTKV